MKTLLFCVLIFLSPRLRAAENLLPAASETQLHAALNDLYSFDFDKANQEFDQIMEDNPNNPFAYLSDAGALWWESSARNDISLPPTWLKSRFEKDIQRATNGAYQLLKSPSTSDQAEGHFILGLSFGELGEWNFIHHRWFRAFLSGKRALSHLKKSLRLDSTYYDAYLGLGSYDYQASRFGFLLKAGAFIGGLHANERRGIEHLIMAEDRGRYSSDQSAIFLATLYTLDKKDYPAALSIIKKLRKKYPQSLYFELIEIGLRNKLNEWNRSLSLGLDVFNKIKSNPTDYQGKIIDLTCGFNPQNCLDPQESSEIVDWMSRALASKAISPDGNNPNRLSLLHLYRGFGEDLTGLRDNAQNDYRWVLEHPDFLEDHAQAQHCLASSCSRKDIINIFLSQSHASSFNPPSVATGTVPSQ